MRRRPGVAPPLALSAASGLVVALAGIPLVWVVINGLGAGDTWSSLLTSGRLRRILVTSLALTAIVGTASAAIGVALSWLAERTDMPGARWISTVAAAPLGVPSFLFAVVLLSIAGPGGLYQSVTGGTASFLYGLSGSAIVLTIACVPFTVILTRSSLVRADASLEEAAQSLGAGKARVFFSITLPILLPAAGAGALLSGLYALADFGTPALMRADTFSAAIYTQITTRFSRSGASALSLVLVALTALMLTAHYRVLRRASGRLGATAVGAPRNELGPVRWLFAFAAWGYIAVVTGVPLVVLSIWALRAGGAEQLQGLGRSVMATLSVAVPAATAGVIVALPVSRLSMRYRGIWPVAASRLAQLGDTIPGIVTALALASVALSYVPRIYQTVTLIVVACVVMFLTRAVQGVTAAMLPVSSDLEDAAATLTESQIRKWMRVILPLARPGLITAWLIIFLSTVKELPATLLLRPPGFNTLATQIWIHSSEGYYSAAAAPALVLVGLSFAATMALQRGGEQFEAMAK